MLQQVNIAYLEFVDEVIIGAPWEVSKDLVEAQGIHVVAEGTVVDSSYKDQSGEDDSFSV